MIQIGGTIYSPINVVMKQQRDGAINKAYGHTQACLRACRHTGRQANLPTNFHHQDEQQMYNNAKMFDFLYFSGE